MSSSLPFIIIANIAILIVAWLVFFLSKNRNENRLTPEASLALSWRASCLTRTATLAMV